MARRSLDDARPGLRAPSLALLGYGEIGSSILFALGIVAYSALGLTPWALLAVGLLALVVALSYAEGVGAMPERGGAATFVRRAFTDLAGFATGWVLFLDYLVVIALAALFVPHYLAAGLGWDGLAERPWSVVAAIGAIVLMLAVRRLPRARLFRIAAVSAAIALVTHLVLAILGLALLVSPDALDMGTDLGSAPTWGAIALALSLAMLAYTGLETVANLTAETDEPGRTLPRGMLVGIGLAVAVNVAVAVVGVSAYPATAGGGSGELGTRWLQAPLAGIAAAIGDELGVGARPIETVVGLSGALVLLTAIGTSLAGAERLAYSMARYDMLPHAFARPERGSVPSWTASLAAAAIASALLVGTDLVEDTARVLASLYSFGVLAAMTAAQLAVIALRAREPELERPFHVPVGIRVRGVEVPLPSAIGAVLTFALWIAALSTHASARIAGPSWLAIGLIVYLVSRRVGGESFLGRAKPAVPDLVPGDEGAVTRIVVPLKLSPIGEEVLATALRLAGEAGASLEVLHVVRVPLSLPLETSLNEDDERAREAVEEAAAIAAEQGVSIETRIMRARSLGEGIVEEARRVGADLIVMGSSPRWRRQSRFFSPTVDEVLRRAPCDVMVVAYPEGVLEEDESG